MTYNEIFSQILSQEKNIKNATMYILKNNRPKQIKVFPNEISDALISKYFALLRSRVSEKTLVDFIPDSIEKETLQVISTDVIDLWGVIKGAKDALPPINTAGIMVEDYNCEGNVILADLETSEMGHIYFLTLHRNVTEWYSNRVRFTKASDGKFHEEKGNILALTPYVDVVIHDAKCFIIDENSFNTIFKFDEVINTQVENHKDEISSLSFISDGASFLSLLMGSKRNKKSMAKIILQKRLDKIKKYEPKYIREQIEGQEKLSFITFNEEDKIIIDNKSSTAIIDILRGAINIDLITKELNGIEEYEENSTSN